MFILTTASQSRGGVPNLGLFLNVLIFILTLLSKITQFLEKKCWTLPITFFSWLWKEKLKYSTLDGSFWPLKTWSLLSYIFLLHIQGFLLIGLRYIMFCNPNVMQNASWKLTDRPNKTRGLKLPPGLQNIPMQFYYIHWTKLCNFKWINFSRIYQI